MTYVVAGFLFALGMILLVLTLPVLAVIGGHLLRGLAWLFMWGLILGIPACLLWLLTRVLS